MILLLFCYSNGEETKISFIARKAILYGGYINFVISNKIKKKKENLFYKLQQCIFFHFHHKKRWKVYKIIDSYNISIVIYQIL